MEHELPVITIIGDNPINVVKDSTYVDEGATVYDIIGGDIGLLMITSSTVDTSIIGTYDVTYTVTNEFDLTDEKIRTVNVIE